MRLMKSVVRVRDDSPGAPHLYAGETIRVFSLSANKWVDAEVKCVEENSVRVEYEIKRCYRKVLHLHSEHLVIPTTLGHACEGVNVRPVFLDSGDEVEVLSSGGNSYGEYEPRPSFHGQTLGHRQSYVPEKYAKKARMADFLASKAVAREGGEKSRVGLQLIDTAVRRLEHRGCRNHELPGYDGKQPFDIVTNDDLRLHHLDSITKQNIDWLKEYKQYADMTTYGVLALVDDEQSFKDWMCSGACHRETRDLPKGRLWVFINSDGEDWIRSPGSLIPKLQSAVNEALFELVKAGRTEQAKRALEEWHADSNALDLHGLRPLMYAFVIHGHAHDIVKVLLGNGADEAELDFVQRRMDLIDRDYPCLSGGQCLYNGPCVCVGTIS